jgi:hypothetical protein
MKKLAAILLLGAAIPAWGVPIINEIRIDQTGADNDEYFELRGNFGDSLNGLTYLVLGDGTGGSGVIEAVIGLTGTIPSSGYWLAVENTFSLAPLPDSMSGTNTGSALNFENSDNVTHLLVSGFTGANGTDLDTDDDGVLDLTPWTSILDAVGLILQANPPTTTEWSYGTSLGGTDVGPDGAFVPGHIFRNPDTLAWTIGQFDPSGGSDTPGAANPVPEPSTIVLASIGGLLFLAVLRRNRR